MRSLPLHRLRRIFIALALVSLTSFASAAEIAKEEWQKTLSTKDSADEVSAIITAKIGGEDVVIIAGEVSAIRGKGIGLEGLVKGAPNGNKAMPDDEEYVDGFVASFSVKTKEVKWVYRYNAGEKDSVKSKFFDLAFDEGSGHAFAVGHKKDASTRMYVPVLTILTASSGKVVKTVQYKSPSNANGNAHFSAVSFFNGGVYMCGTDTSGVKAGRKRLDSSEKVDGGLFFVRADSKTGSESWSRQSGKDRLRDRCSGIASSDDGASVYFSTTEVSKASTGQKSPPTGQVVGYSLKTATGDLTWRAAIPRGANVQDIAMGVAQKDEAVYLSSAKWTDVYRGKKIYLYKLSAHTGQRLFSIESCCGDILNRLPGNFKGRGSAEPARGLFVGDDGFIYQFGSYKVKEESTKDGFANLVVRTSIFGDRDAGKDSSTAVEKYQFEATKPRMMAPTVDRKGLIAVELFGDLFGSNAEAHNAKIIDITLAPVEESRKVTYRSSKGKYFVEVYSRLTALAQKNTPLAAFSTVVADALHLPSNQVVAHHDGKTDETVVTVFVYTDNTDGGKGGKEATEVQKKLDALLNNSGDKQSQMEDLLGLRKGALKVVESSKVIRTGAKNDLGALSSADGSNTGNKAAAAAPVSSPKSNQRSSSSSSSASSSSSTPETSTASPRSELESKMSNIPKAAIIGGSVGAGVAVIAIIAVIVCICRK